MFINYRISINYLLLNRETLKLSPKLAFLTSVQGVHWARSCWKTIIKIYLHSNFIPRAVRLSKRVLTVAPKGGEQVSD